MRSYSNFSVRDLLDAFASTAPAPGRRFRGGSGGCDRCLAAADGAGHPNLEARTNRRNRSELAAVRRPASVAAATIAALIDRDANAYSSVIAALRHAGRRCRHRARQQAALESAHACRDRRPARDDARVPSRAARCALRRRAEPLAARRAMWASQSNCCVRQSARAGDHDRCESGSLEGRGLRRCRRARSDSGWMPRALPTPSTGCRCCLAGPAKAGLRICDRRSD